MTVADRIRQACAEVARRAKHVRVDQRTIEPYALSLPLEKAVAPSIDWNTHYRGEDDAATAAFFVTLDAINFGSGYFPHLRKRPGMSGYFTVATSLKEEFERNGPMPAKRLAGITQQDCLAIFRQDPKNAAVGELMGLFARALNDLGRLLLEKYDESFAKLIQAAGHSALRLVGLLAAMPFFRDEQRYDDLIVPFYKRAQLTAADLSLALAGQGLGRFDDLAQLTIFADNLVPHVLRVDGVLSYDQELAARIDREELIEPGSPQEIEIRAGALHAVELMAAALRRAGNAVTAMGLDYVLWNRGQQPHYKTIKPRHRARTVYY